MARVTHWTGRYEQGVAVPACGQKGRSLYCTAYGDEKGITCTRCRKKMEEFARGVKFRRQAKEG